MKLRLQYFGHLMWRTNSLEETLMLGKIGGGEGDDRGWDGWMASPTRWTWVWVSSRSWWWTGKQSMGSQRDGHNWATELNIIITMMNVRYEWMLVIINTFTYSPSLVWILSWNLVVDIMTPAYTGLSKQAADYWSSAQRYCTPLSPTTWNLPCSTGSYNPLVSPPLLRTLLTLGLSSQTVFEGQSWRVLVLN